MSARRLGRLLGTTLILIAFAALGAGLLGAADDGVLNTDDYEWSAKLPVSVVDAPSRL